MRILVSGKHVSTRGGGEAVLPYNYFKYLRERGIEVWLIAHERSRDELSNTLANDAGRVYFVNDDRISYWISCLSQYLPKRLAGVTTGAAIGLITEWKQRRLARTLVRQHKIDVIHQAMPVSPKQPSLMFGLGAPVVIGPMNGGMDYPRAFKNRSSIAEALVLRAGRLFAYFANLLLPGKWLGERLLVANRRTQQALPVIRRQGVDFLVENGVDLRLWKKNEVTADNARTPTRFVYLGRLIDWKGLDLLFEAYAQVCDQNDTELHIIGDGPERVQLEAFSAANGIESSLYFHGQLPREECARLLETLDVLVLPSLHECGGAVVLEAMAMQLPVVATNWGGPSDYLDETCGILIDPVSRESFVESLAEAMGELVADPASRQRLGAAGRQRVEAHFDWQRKIDRILDIYSQVTGHSKETAITSFTSPHSETRLGTDSEEKSPANV
jgi:glycosyltransferase involved in cell wall biosynthesis